ncbi:myosin regulatory light polypeptide 9-like [Argiope bruennichi]|uniref:Myosin regulatory light polypeptide 9 like protein n=1 Tax=Argiope bruennichi TaxID=94029 RepID=A0A8T0E2J4_ARGBR|nr:myosin regulatory light polypeptide 9-like [Argiope bruennichi]KAF8764395.1 Myosin regulatory light polypeptide 9 like protein [Argiope bruennichi]
MSKKTKSDSQKKTARRATSNVFAMFEQNQIAEFKEAFQLIDSNKDGLIDKNDLRATFDSLGKIVSENDLNSMLSEAPGPINFTMFLTIFGERIAGTDQEEVIKKAFDTFDPDGAGKINEKKLRKALITWGEKLTNSEVDEAFKEAPIDREGMIDINSYVKVICGTATEEE